MRLVAIYLFNKSLPHVFGENHEGLTLNFGGQYFYSIRQNGAQLIVNREEENVKFIEDFYSSEISLITALVGRNGIGKTSILRALNGSIDNRRKNLFYLFETDDTLYYYDELKFESIQSELDLTKIDSNDINSVKLYYTPIVDIEQLNSYSQLNLLSSQDENLKHLYLKQVLQDVRLLNDPVKPILKSVYKDFPEYDKLQINVTQHRRLNIKNVYATSNLGNQDRSEVLKVYIEDDIRKFKDNELGDSVNPEFFKDNYLKRYIQILNSSGLNSFFDELWELPEYSNELGNDKLHNEANFIINFELTLFTYFILDATFPRTPFQGTYDSYKILNAKGFKDRFNCFFDFYLSNIYVDIRDNVFEKLKRVSIEDYDEIKKITYRDTFKKFTLQGFKSEDAFEHILRYIERFKAFYDLYVKLTEIINEDKLDLKGGSLIYDINRHNESDFYDLIDVYNKVLAVSNNFVYTLDLLSISSLYPLSSGEKALLNFFSRINHAIEGIKKSSHPTFNYYLLLLDEPELGYHPIWKRKFIDAISKSLPILFGKLIPDRDFLNSKSNEIGKLKFQIIFTTHDPLTLSDIPADNVLFIDWDSETGQSKIITQRQDSNFVTFGANVHDLLAHSFFLKDGFMGEFAKDVVSDLINYLTYNKEEKETEENVKPIREWNPEKAEKVMGIIDEPFIKERVQSLFNKKVLYNDRELLRLKIIQLIDQFNKLENEKD
jgi:energy-coupling factor transporter ATP-binding protein EcfA2